MFVEWWKKIVFFFFWKRFLGMKFWGKKWRKKGETRYCVIGRKGNLSLRILAHCQSHCIDLTTTIIRRTVIRKKGRKNGNNKSCCGYKRHTCLREGWKVCISSMNGQRLKISHNPSNRQIPRIFDGARFRKYTLQYTPSIVLSDSLFTKPWIIAWL